MTIEFVNPMPKVHRKQFPRIVETVVNGDQKVFQVDCRKKGYTGTKRKNFANLKVAKEYAQKIAREAEVRGIEGINISLIDRQTLTQAKDKLDAFNSAEATSYSVLDAVEEFIKWKKKEIQDKELPKVEQAVREFLIFKQTPYGGKGGAPLRSKTLTELKDRLGRFKEHFEGSRVDEITKTDIRDYVFGITAKENKTISNQTRKNIKTKISQFFNWCKEDDRNWISLNPCNGLKIVADEKQIKVFENEEVSSILDNAFNDKYSNTILPYYVLGFYAGIRPNEIRRLSLSDIKWDKVSPKNRHVQILISNTQSKTKRTRHAELHSQGQFWLNLLFEKNRELRFSTEKLNPSRRSIERIEKKSNLKNGWIQDGARHTYISNWLSEYKDVNHLCLICGNSVKIIQNHYFSSISDKESNEYWQIGNEEIFKYKNELYEREHVEKYGIRSDELPWESGEPSDEEKMELELYRPSEDRE